MVYFFSGSNINTMFYKIYRNIMNKGDDVSPRRKRTKELLHVVTEIENPLEKYLLINKRYLNPFFHFVENMWILKGKGDYQTIDIFNKQMKKYLDDKEIGEYYGSYGHRMRHYNYSKYHKDDFSAKEIDQIEDVITKLKMDKTTRRGVISIWNPNFDNSNYMDMEDIPCNIALTFKIRKNKLHLSIFNRSNDFIYGLSCTNICQFSTILEYVSNSISSEIGSQIHYSDSLHIYEKNEVHTRLQNHLLEFKDVNLYCKLEPFKMKNSIHEDDFKNKFDSDLNIFLNKYLTNRFTDDNKHFNFNLAYFNFHVAIFDLLWFYRKKIMNKNSISNNDLFIYFKKLTELIHKYKLKDFLVLSLAFCYNNARKLNLGTFLKKYDELETHFDKDVWNFIIS